MYNNIFNNSHSFINYIFNLFFKKKKQLQPFHPFHFLLNFFNL